MDVVSQEELLALSDDGINDGFVESGVDSRARSIFLTSTPFVSSSNRNSILGLGVEMEERLQQSSRTLPHDLRTDHSVPFHPLPAHRVVDRVLTDREVDKLNFNRTGTGNPSVRFSSQFNDGSGLGNRFSSRTACFPEGLTADDTLNRTYVSDPSETMFKHSSFARSPHTAVRPDCFDGASCDWQDFIVHFEQVSAWNRWTNVEKAQQLTMCLRGTAQTLLSNLTIGQLNDFNAVKNALGQRFNQRGRNLAFRSEFRNRIQGKDESITEFGYKLRRLGLLAYPEASYTSLEPHLIDQFLNGLTSFNMRKHVSFSHPITLDDAMSHAVSNVRVTLKNPLLGY